MGWLHVLGLLYKAASAHQGSLLLPPSTLA
jgi:hypothetical protein